MTDIPKQTIWYSTCDDSGEIYSFTTWGACDVTDEFHAEMAARECAEDYHGNHDGWDCGWPIDITIHAEGGGALFTFSVEMEMAPQFRATRKEAE